jgi:O-antigen ligase/polysaccharide polymerase Wzy-like membrane protein
LSRSLSVAALSALLLVLPFEPRRPTLPVLGFELTLLEGIAAAAAALLLYANRDRLVGLLRRPPLPLAFLWSYVAAQLLSAAVAPMNRGLAVKFALRMAAAAVFALAVAATPPDVLRRSIRALTVACAVVAVLAILEGTGVTGPDPFLDRFRRAPFWIGLSRRASAGSESPNLAAAMLLYGLVPAVGLAALRRRPSRVVVPLTVLFSLGVLLTYSRGGLVALAAALMALGSALAVRHRSHARAPLLALLTFLAAAAAFAVTARSWRALPYPAEGVPAYAARYAPGEAFLSFGPGEVRAVPITLTNTGSQPWSTAVLGCSWQRAEAERSMDWPATAACPITPVPPAAPGESVRVEAAVRAPVGEGRYLLVWDLRADGWVMSSAGVPPATVPTVVSLDPAAAQPFSYAVPATAWQRGRGALWRTAVAMWRERPLLGIGPDNFRWAHAAYAGWPRGGQDALIPANNMFLEAAATTGTLGLIALLGTLVATARVSLESLSRAPAGSPEAAWSAVTLALIAGIAVHGMVDSFLGFTGHYLFLGLVVGAASAYSTSLRLGTPAFDEPESTDDMRARSVGSGNGSASSSRPSRVATSTPGSGGSTT